jgi:hypothetical protein
VAAKPMAMKVAITEVEIIFALIDSTTGSLDPQYRKEN